MSASAIEMHKPQTTLATQGFTKELPNRKTLTLINLSCLGFPRCTFVVNASDLSPDMYHGSRCRHKIRLANVVALFFPGDDIADKFGQVIVRSAAAHEFMQIVLPHGEQAGANLAVGGDANAAAMSAERMRDRRDDSDFTNPVVEAVTPGGFAAGMRDFDERTILGHAEQDFVERDHNVRRPDPVLFKRHELYEAHDHPFFARKHSEWNNLVFVEAPHQYAINFDRPETRFTCGTHSCEHMIETSGHARDAGKAVRINRVHADGDAVQAGISKRLSQVGQ